MEGFSDLVILADLTISDVTAIISAVAAALVLIVGAVTAGVVKIIGGQKAANKEREVNQASNNKKLGEIHELTNSRLSEIQRKLDTALERIAGMEKAALVQTVRAAEMKAELAAKEIPAPQGTEPVPVVVIPDKPVPVTISEQSKEKAGTDSR